MDANRILPRLFVGACPVDTDDIDRLKQELGITAVLDLQTEDDFANWNINWPSLESHYRSSGIEVRRVSVRDFSPEALRILLPNCVQALRELLGEGHTVLVHCSEGVNRAPSTVIAYLHWIKQWNYDRAVKHVTQCRDCDPYLEAIRLATEDRRK